MRLSRVISSNALRCLQAIESNLELVTDSSPEGIGILVLEIFLGARQIVQIAEPSIKPAGNDARSTSGWFT